MSGRQDIRSVPYFQTNVALEIRCEPNRAFVSGSEELLERFLRVVKYHVINISEPSLALAQNAS